MMQSRRRIELLAPASNADIAIEAIIHGADAVYIGPSDFGARKSASNSIQDIKRVVDFAHPFGVKVYATVNTIIFDNEIARAEALISDLYKIGVDALIVQDMGIVRMNIPPIALHASTQCDTRTPEKALFLQNCGFSQLVLARELTPEEIKAIHDVVNVPLESFVHGALCVSYSGRCHASQALTGRSANRGECAQICRWKYNLYDADGKVLARNKHLLSLKDLNLSDRLETLLDAGVSSFKIEGRLKDAGYVKNIVAFYRQKIDRIISQHPEKYVRSSFGSSEIIFNPQPEKSFNRGFTHYFIDSRRPADISNPLTPKSMGEEIKDIKSLNNGDGISFFNSRKEYEGVMVNGIKDNKIIGNRYFTIPKGSKIHRTLDVKWQKQMQRPSATRKIVLNVKVTSSALFAEDERGVKVTVQLPQGLEQAKNPRSIREMFDKFGNTIYRLEEFDETDFNLFIPASVLSDIRHRVIELLDRTAKATYRFDYREKEISDFSYPEKQLDYRDNVANHLAEKFYMEHGVTEINPAMEIEGANRRDQLNKGRGNGGHEKGRVVMTTRHCILREMGKCLQECKPDQRNFRLPLYLKSSDNTFSLDFDCKNCEMQVRTL